MPRRLLALAVAALVLLLTTGCADDVSPAVQVDDVKIGNDAFLAEVAEWTGNPRAVDPAMLANSSPGTYPQDLVRQLLQQRIDFTIHNEEFEHLGLQLDDDMRQTALETIFGDASASTDAFSAFSDDFAQSFTDDVARQIAVQTELGDSGYEAWRTKAYAEAEIVVNPRYGSWDDDTAQVTSPEDPNAAPDVTSGA